MLNETKDKNNIEAMLQMIKDVQPSIHTILLIRDCESTQMLSKWRLNKKYAFQADVCFEIKDMKDLTKH